MLGYSYLSLDNSSPFSDPAFDSGSRTSHQFAAGARIYF